MHTVGPGVWRETKCLGKLETHTVGSEIWREILNNVKNEKSSLKDLEFGEKPEKTWKIRQNILLELAYGEIY